MQHSAIIVILWRSSCWQKPNNLYNYVPKQPKLPFGYEWL